MTPELVLFGIKALIRIGQQTDKALIDYAADKPTTLGEVEIFKLTDKRDLLNNFLILPHYVQLSKADPFKSIWDASIPGGGGIGSGWDGLSPDQQSAAYLFALSSARGDGQALAELGDKSFKPSPYAADALAGQVLIEQWKPENEPVSPFGRVVLAIVEVSLDYAAQDPGVFRTGASGEKIISAFAIALAKPLTARLNADTLGTASQLANGMMVALVGASLQVLKDHSADFISDQHLAKLAGNVLDPIVAAAQGGDVLFQVQLKHILDAMAGPAAQAAMRTVAENPGAFLGRNFDSSKAAGALVSAMLLESAKNPDVSVTFSENGRLKLLAAALQVVADKPGLFIRTGDDQDAVAALATDLTSSFATQLKDSVFALVGDKQIDGRALAAGIAASALEAFGRHSDALIGDAGEPWHDVARSVAKDVLGSLATAIKSPDGAALKQVFSEEKLVELGQIVVEGIAANPAMTGVSGAKAQEVVSAVSSAISVVAKQKKRLLVTQEDWLDLTRTMVKEVAARPDIIAGDNTSLQSIVTAFGAVIAGDKNSILTGANATDVMRTLLQEVAARPAMLVGVRDDMQRVAAAVAAAMAADPHLLLSGSNWVQIVDVAMSEASKNPARLFGLNYNDGGQALAADMIGLVLKTLPTLPPPGGAASGAILNGDVLCEAMTIVLRYMSGAPDRAKKYAPLLQAATTDVSAFVAANPGNYGSKEWLRLVDVLTGDIMSGKFDAELTTVIAGGSVSLIRTPKDADALLGRAA